MKTAIQLVLIYFGFLQILAPMLMVVPCIIYLLATTGAVDKDSLMQMIIIPAQMTGILLMVIYFFLPGSVSLAILRSGLPASCSACIAGKEIIDVHHTLWARVRMSSFL